MDGDLEDIPDIVRIDLAPFRSRQRQRSRRPPRQNFGTRNIAIIQVQKKRGSKGKESSVLLTVAVDEPESDPMRGWICIEEPAGDGTRHGKWSENGVQNTKKLSEGGYDKYVVLSRGGEKYVPGQVAAGFGFIEPFHS